MIKSLSVFLMLLTMMPCARADDRTELGRSYLEGIWLIGQKPDAGTCKEHYYTNNQIEFEFKKTGGRVLYFEPPDLFTATQLSSITIDNDIITVLLQPIDNTAPPLALRIRKIDNSRMEFVPENGDPPKDADYAYRCGDPDGTVNGGVTPEALSVLTPIRTGSGAFVQVPPGVSDADTCTRVSDPPYDRASLQFEVYGPVHFWLIGIVEHPHRVFELDTITSISQVGPDTIRVALHVQFRKDASIPADYVLTIINTPSHIEIPELSATFARCPEIFGMHRW